jgi:hypothetical protein
MHTRGGAATRRPCNRMSAWFQSSLTGSRTALRSIKLVRMTHRIAGSRLRIAVRGAFCVHPSTEPLISLAARTRLGSPGGVGVHHEPQLQPCMCTPQPSL